MKSSAERSAKYYKDHTPGPGVIGKVPKLAPGAVNPMWATQEGLEPFLEAHPEFLTPPKKKKQNPFNVNFPTTKKLVDIDIEEDVVP